MKIAHKVMIEIKKENKIWEKYFGLIQVEVNHTYPELYTAGAVLVLSCACFFWTDIFGRNTTASSRSPLGSLFGVP